MLADSPDRQVHRTAVSVSITTVVGEAHEEANMIMAQSLEVRAPARPEVDSETQCPKQLHMRTRDQVAEMLPCALCLGAPQMNE